MYNKSNSTPKSGGFGAKPTFNSKPRGYGQPFSKPFQTEGGSASGGSFSGGNGGSSYAPSRGGSRGFSGGRGGQGGYQSGGSGSRFSRGGGSFGGSRGGSRGGGRGGSRFGFGQRIDVSKFINKTIVEEVVEAYTPEHKFADFLVEERLKVSIQKKGYVMPTPIQDKSVPHILRGEDVVGIANTGTGKTGAFLIPLINKVLLDKNENILVIVPTRELALQIEGELKSLTFGMSIWSVCCVGGAPIGRQIAQLKHQNNFVIGTPGRLKDLIERKLINRAHFKTIVLDEADRMLDMGFVHDMRFVMAGMPKDRQTLFFSATMDPAVEKLIHEFLRTPVRISVKTRDTSKNIDQDVIRLQAGEVKIDVLHDLLDQPEFSKVIIFGRTKHGVERLSNLLVTRGFKAESIHGDKSQSGRQKALNFFKNNTSKILVATDVAARGLDIPDVSHVINFDLPATHDDYVHRIGRTGRGNKKGKALTFID